MENPIISSSKTKIRKFSLKKFYFIFLCGLLYRFLAFEIMKKKSAKFIKIAFFCVY